MGVAQDNTCLPVIKALTEGQKTPDIYMEAEKQFRSMRTDAPSQTVASLTEIMQGIVKQGSVSVRIRTTTSVRIRTY
jgi:hypothetical protein